VTSARTEDEHRAPASIAWLSTLVIDPARVGEVPSELVPVLVLRVAGEPVGDDELLDVNETARRLAVSRDWVYRNGKVLPFAMRVGTRHLRFSSRGLDRWLRTRQGR
jgi:predicted DNA-binding transcriptional regulator AlpA